MHVMSIVLAVSPASSKVSAGSTFTLKMMAAFYQESHLQQMKQPWTENRSELASQWQSFTFLFTCARPMRSCLSSRTNGSFAACTMRINRLLANWCCRSLATFWQPWRGCTAPGKIDSLTTTPWLIIRSYGSSCRRAWAAFKYTVRRYTTNISTDTLAVCSSRYTCIQNACSISVPAVLFDYTTALALGVRRLRVWDFFHSALFLLVCQTTKMGWRK